MVGGFPVGQVQGTGNIDFESISHLCVILNLHADPRSMRRTIQRPAACHSKLGTSGYNAAGSDRRRMSGRARYQGRFFALSCLSFVLSPLRLNCGRLNHAAGFVEFVAVSVTVLREGFISVLVFILGLNGFKEGSEGSLKQFF